MVSFLSCFPRSRLGCQILVRADMEGMTVSAATLHMSCCFGIWNRVIAQLSFTFLGLIGQHSRRRILEKENRRRHAACQGAYFRGRLGQNTHCLTTNRTTIFPTVHGQVDLWNFLSGYLLVIVIAVDSCGYIQDFNRSRDDSFVQKGTDSDWLTLSRPSSISVKKRQD